MNTRSYAYAKGYAQGEKIPRFVSTYGPAIWEAGITTNKVMGAGLVAAGLVFSSKVLAVSGIVNLASAAVMSGCKKRF